MKKAGDKPAFNNNVKMTPQDTEKLKYYTDKLLEKGIVIDDYQEWVDHGLSLAGLGEEGRDIFHKISSTSAKYDYKATDDKFSNLLKSHNGKKGIASFYRFCIDLQQIPKYSPKPTSRQTPRSLVSITESLLTVQSANLWIEGAASRPTPRMLFGQFWYEDELCILFSDTNTGKTILSVQAGNHISKGVSLPWMTIEAKYSVLYCDFELTDKQFQLRYSDSSNPSNNYKFDSNFYRAEINPDSLPPEGLSFEDYLYNSLEKSIVQWNIKVLIVDNLTYLRTETEKAKDALPLMKQLKKIKAQYKLSILCLAHTPKRDLTKPITRNDLMGSKMLINFCDSSFAIGESSQDKNIRYLKQIKARNTEILYDSENVITVQISKTDNFLKFEFLGYGNEADHLKQRSEKEKEQRLVEVVDLHKRGVSNVEIGKQFGVSEAAVRKWLKKAVSLEPLEPHEPSSSSSNGSSKERHEGEI